MDLAPRCGANGPVGSALKRSCAERRSAEESGGHCGGGGGCVETRRCCMPVTAVCDLLDCRPRLHRCARCLCARKGARRGNEDRQH